jgi:hypothetical protein
MAATWARTWAGSTVLVVQHPGHVQHQQARLVDLDARLGQPVLHIGEVRQVFAKGVALQRALGASCRASSHWPMVRMQWCTRPGPRRACAMAKPSPQSPSKVGRARAHPATGFRNALRRVVVHHGDVAHDLHAGGVQGTSTMLWLVVGRLGIGRLSSPSALRHMTISNRQCGCAAPVMNHLRPLITNCVTTRRTVVCRLVGSLEATSGSDIAKAERMSPRAAAAAATAPLRMVAKRCSSSMLPVSGALQLNTSAAQGRRPMASASGA